MHVHTHTHLHDVLGERLVVLEDLKKLSLGKL